MEIHGRAADRGLAARMQTRQGRCAAGCGGAAAGSHGWKVRRAAIELQLNTDTFCVDGVDLHGKRRTVVFSPSSRGQLALIIYEWNDARYIGIDSDGSGAGQNEWEDQVHRLGKGYIAQADANHSSSVFMFVTSQHIAPTSAARASSASSSLTCPKVLQRMRQASSPLPCGSILELQQEMAPMQALQASTRVLSDTTSRKQATTALDRYQSPSPLVCRPRVTT